MKPQDEESRIYLGVISMFYGIIISLYHFDNLRQKAPYFHVKYQDEEAVLTIPESEVLEEGIKRGKRFIKLNR